MGKKLFYLALVKRIVKLPKLHIAVCNFYIVHKEAELINIGESCLYDKTIFKKKTQENDKRKI